MAALLAAAAVVVGLVIIGCGDLGTLALGYAAVSGLGRSGLMEEGQQALEQGLPAIALQVLAAVVLRARLPRALDSWGFGLLAGLAFVSLAWPLFVEGMGTALGLLVSPEMDLGPYVLALLPTWAPALASVAAFAALGRRRALLVCSDRAGLRATAARLD